MTKATASGNPPSPEQAITLYRKQPLQAVLADNLTSLQQAFANCSDLIIHRITPQSGPPGCLVYIDGLVQRDLVDRDVLTPLLLAGLSTDLQAVASGTTPLSETKLLHSVGEVVERVLSGEATLLVDGTAAALAFGVRGWEARSIGEPQVEASIRGPRESFVETLRFNTAMLRRKVKSPALKLEALKVGRVTQTDVVIAYIEGIADQPLVEEVRRRISRINIDGVLESGYVEEFLEDSPYSPFPQVQNTERPDTAAAHLLEGRVAIMVDGTPFVLIVPVVLAQLMQASEDYYERFLIGSAIRFLRYIFLLVALLAPSLYVAIITYHQEMLPTTLLLSVAAAREGVPFPALVEALMMEITFEILREAGVRLPRPVGQAVSIVGALVIGEASVRAGLVSAPMVIIVAVTGIASFSIPRYNASTAFRMLRFPLMFLAGSLGMFGIVAGLGGILLHLCSLRSFGMPYLSPVAPLSLSGLKDTLVRAPHWLMRQRPSLLAASNSERVPPGQRPGPDRGRWREE